VTKLKLKRPCELESKRFCLTCNDYRKFTYRPQFKHSACVVCGKHWASRYPSVEWYEAHLKALESKVRTLENQVKSLKGVLRSRESK